MRHSSTVAVSLVSLALGAAIALSGLARLSRAADLSASYRWRPVRLGAGGFVAGFLSHPRDAAVRYCRTDVGNAYRWDSAKQEWLPMVVRAGSRGLPAGATRAPQQGGVSSLGLDPHNPSVVYMTYGGRYSADVAKQYPPVRGNVYKSTDGGNTFTGGDLNVSLSPNSDDKFFGERIAVDPASSASVYLGTEKDGLWHSADGGRHWTQVTGNGAPGAGADITRILFVAQAVYVVGLNGSVLRSADGGRNWTNVSAGTALDGKAGSSVAGTDGAIYVIQNSSRNIWKYRNGAWSAIVSDIAYEQNISGLAVDPAVPNGQRMYVIGGGGEVAGTNDGGKTWNQWGNALQFAGSFGWLPQAVGYRNTAGIFLAKDGALWVPQGNEGMLSYVPTGQETWNSPRWTISSKGIEEFVTHDVVLPPGGRAVVAVQDSTALTVLDPSQFTALHATLQDQLICNGSGLAYCPDAPTYIACAAADVNHTHSGATYSGFSSDGGRSWTRFQSTPSSAPAAGSIAVSRRAGWGLGSDHLADLPSNGDIPYYSQDGGKTWLKSSGFPVGDGYWDFSLKQRQLAADPFVADTFYCEGTWKGGFFVSTNGGKTWQEQTHAGLPQSCHHGQLAVNRSVKNDLWFADGWEGASTHGLWHSTNGGQTFAKLPGIEHAITLALGAGRGRNGDAPYTVYFYGKMTDDDWGVFRSINGGTNWDRIARFPCGLVDEPTCMAASWDAFGTVYVGFNGNSFVYGTAAGAGT